MSLQTLYNWASLAALVALSAVVALTIGPRRPDRSCESYSHINRVYACGEPPAIDKAGYVETEHDLRGFIDDQVARGRLSTAAVYFRDLHGGPAFGVNDGQTFTPASLLKLPMVLAYFTLAEDDRAVLETRIAYSNATLHKARVPGGIDAKPEVLQEGAAYTVEDLLKHMIVHSDNLAYYLLLDHLDSDVEGGVGKLLRTYQEVGIVDPRNTQEEVVTVRGYASLFRLLYNVSYLDADDSETVLHWLTEATFVDGLYRGVPRNVAIAHKYGARDVPDGTKQLHDCGIVYYPGNPYLVCVMTRGRDYGELATVIGTLSNIVYREVDSWRQ